ncbi:MAG: hypothetical protein AABZ30_09875 [Myxococcota bacterium]
MSVRDEDLQAYFDDELAPAERARVEKEIAADPDATKRLEALGEMRVLLREGVALAHAQAEADAPTGAWAAVRAGIRKPPTLGERAGEWVRARWFVPTLAAAGVAATLAITLAISGGPARESTADAPRRKRSKHHLLEKTRMHPPKKRPVVATRPIVEIESIDTVAAGSSFMRWDQPEGGTPVVWIEEEE